MVTDKNSGNSIVNYHCFFVFLISSQTSNNNRKTPLYTKSHRYERRENNG